MMGHRGRIELRSTVFFPQSSCVRNIAAFLIVSAVIAASSPLFAADKVEPQWTPLFNGKDLSGWTVVHDATFAVTNGNLRLVTGMGWLRTEKEYSDFILELEWRALDSGYDSGIFLRAGLDGKPWPEKGCQVNLLRASLGGLVCGSKLVVPSETPPAPLNEWVKFRITARGAKIALDVNGERAWEYEKAEPGKGFIGFQAENKVFEFRNIQVSESGPAPANPN
jgi:hypothetical protein